MQKNPLLKPFYKLLCFFSIFFSLVLADQFLKYKIRLNGGFYLCNQGISFGINVPNIVFWLVLGIFFLIFMFFIYKKRLFSCFFIVGLALFISGALSNIIDRFLFGCILDYISFYKKLFPVFNMADIGIFTGVCIIFFEIIIKNPSKK